MGNAPSEGFNLDNYQYQEDKVDFHLGQIRIFVNQLTGENICIIEKMIQDVNYKFRKMEHPAILQILFANQIQKQIVLEYSSNTLFQNILHRQKKKISYNEEQLWGIMKPVIDSYIYLKQYDIHPMDVKSILISSQGTIKLHSIYEKNLSYYMQFLSGLQDEIFLSPEEIKYYKKKEFILNLDFEKCQIFQLGLILLFAASLTSINQLFSQDTLEFQDNLAQQSIQNIPYNNDFKKALSKMLNINPNQRGNYFEYKELVSNKKCNANVIYIEETSNQQTPRQNLSQQLIIKKENTQAIKLENKQESKQENKQQNEQENFKFDTYIQPQQFKQENKQWNQQGNIQFDTYIQPQQFKQDNKQNQQKNIKFDTYIQPQQFSSLNQGQSYEYYSIQRPQPQQQNLSIQSNQQFYKADKIQNFSLQNTDLRQTINQQQIQQNPTLQISTISPQQSQVQQSIHQQNTLQQFNQNLASTFNPYQLNLPQQNIQQIKLPIQQGYQNNNPQQEIQSRRGSIRNQLQSSSKPKIPQQFTASSGEQSQRILSSSRLQYQNQYQNYNQPYLNQQYSNQLDSKVEQVLKEAQNTIRKFDEVNLKLSSFSAQKGLPSRTSSVSSKNVTSDQNLNRILNRANYEVQRSKQ